MTAVPDEAAEVYARSLLELAKQAGGAAKASEVGEELAAIDSIIRAMPSFAELLRSPRVDRDRRGEMLRTVLSGRVSDLVLRTVLVMNRRGRSGEVAHLDAAYRELLDADAGRVRVTVFSPPGPPPAESLLAMIRGRVKEVLGREAVIETTLDPAMIGGLKLRIGDRLVDGSVATQLRRLEQSLLSDGTAAVRSQFQKYLDEVT